MLAPEFYMQVKRKTLFHVLSIKFNLYMFPIKLHPFHEADSPVRKHTFLPLEVTPGTACCGQLYT